MRRGLAIRMSRCDWCLVVLAVLCVPGFVMLFRLLSGPKKKDEV